MRSLGEGDNVELNQLIHDNGYLPYRDLTFADILAAWKPQPKYAQSTEISTSIWTAPISDLDNAELNLLTFDNDISPKPDESYAANLAAGAGAPQSLNPFLPNYQPPDRK